MQQVWRKRWQSTGWIALAATTLVLLISAINNKNHKLCNGIEVSFSKDGSNFFVDEKGIVAILTSFGPIKGEQIDKIDLKALEQRIRSDRWIANAELFFDNKQVLQVIVEEKEPVARIFTVSGDSFYIDSACKKLSLSEKLSARVPMFTNFPSDRQVLSRPDSALLASAKELALYIQSDDFWTAQVAQIDITANGFEMIPTVGSHVVALGKKGEWQTKFDRLFSFYKQVWTQVGFEKYEKLDVQFKGQVVATVKGGRPARVDSVKARMAYENILAEVKKMDADSSLVGETKVTSEGDAIVKTAAQTTHSTSMRSVEAKVKRPSKRILPIPVKKGVPVSIGNQGVSGKDGQKEKKEGPQMPKAIMKRPLSAIIEQQKRNNRR